MSDKSKIFLFFSPNSTESTRFDFIKNYLIKDGWKVADVIDLSLVLTEYNKNYEESLVCLSIINPSSYIFSTNEFKLLKDFCQLGNSIFIASTGFDEDGDNCQTNLNHITALLCGVSFNQDCVIRPNPYGSYHPKEARLEEFIANRGLGDIIDRYYRDEKRQSKTTTTNNLDLSSLSEKDDDNDDNFDEIFRIIESDNDSNDDDLIRKSNSFRGDNARILYVNGCTLNVLSKQSTIMMTSSRWSLPNEQCICTFYKPTTVDFEKKNCRIVLIGSNEMFNDIYIHKEFNRILFKTLINFIEDKNFPINISDARTIEIPKYVCTPDIMKLIDLPICCLKEPETLPEDRRALLENNLFNIDSSMLPSIAEGFKSLDVNYEPLTLIKPKLELKPLRLRPATYGFPIRIIR